MAGPRPTSAFVHNERLSCPDTKRKCFLRKTSMSDARPSGHQIATSFTPLSAHFIARTIALAGMARLSATTAPSLTP